MIHTVGGARRLGQRASELLCVVALGVVASPGRLRGGSLLQPCFHCSEAETPVRVILARWLVGHSFPHARIHPRDRTLQTARQRSAAQELILLGRRPRRLLFIASIGAELQELVEI